MQEREELFLFFSKVLILTALVSIFLFSQVQLVTSHDSYTTRSESAEIERILEECGIEIYTIRWAEMNHIASNRGIDEYYDIVGLDGVNYSLILSVSRSKRPKYVSSIRLDDSSYTILYQDEIDYNRRQEHLRIKALVIEALEGYSTEWRRPLDALFLMIVLDGYEISVQDVRIVAEISFELPSFVNDEDELVFLSMLDDEGREYIAVIVFPSERLELVYDVENDTRLSLRGVPST